VVWLGESVTSGLLLCVCDVVDHGDVWPGESVTSGLSLWCGQVSVTSGLSLWCGQVRVLRVDSRCGVAR